MEKDNSIRNQKVFIRLQSLLDLHARYNSTAQEYAKLKEQGGTLQSSLLDRKRTFEQVFEMLELPYTKL
jgi:hypothetical protein